jgi:phospholipase C
MQSNPGWPSQYLPSRAGYDWATYPERLVKAGISWKVYQDAGAGLDAEHFWGWGDDAFIGNYGDNSLLYFHQYQNAQPGSPLHQGARTATNISQGGTLFDFLRQDVAANKLPQVSWIVAPEAYSEHGNWPANFGAWYVDQILDALTSNPEVWSKTVFFLMFDENDGFFDHAVPATPPASPAQGLSTVDTTNEIFPGNSVYARGPYGLGIRVPMTVISPWSKGGWVNSEVFDHTSLIRFIEQRFAHERHGLIESNITDWRRAVVGDLTSCFDFRSPNAAIVSLPSTAGYVPPDFVRHDDYLPALPTVQGLPKQEPGIRPARAVPYELHVLGETDVSVGTVGIRFGNSGRSAAVFQVRFGNHQDGPWTYTVGGGAHLFDTWGIRARGLSAYDLSVYGPNGFLHQLKGSIQGRDKANLAVRSSYDTHGDPGITLDIHNRGAEGGKVRIFDAYTKQTIAHFVAPGRTLVWHWSLETSFGWYDLTIEVESDSSFRQRLAGHVETGKDSMSDPALGA